MFVCLYSRQNLAFFENPSRSKVDLDPLYQNKRMIKCGFVWCLWADSLVTENIHILLYLYPLLKPVQFNPCNGPLLAVDGIAYACQQLLSAAPGAGLQSVVEEGKCLQLQLLGLAHLFHYAVFSTPWKKLPIISVRSSQHKLEEENLGKTFYIYVI